MTTQKAIENNIQADRARFYQTIYDGNLPQGLRSAFEAAILNVPSEYTNLNCKVIKAIWEKPEYDWTFFQVGAVINLVSKVEPKHLQGTTEEVLEKQIAIEALSVEYNKKVDEKEKQLKVKFNQQMRAAGLDKQAISMKEGLIAKN